MKKLCALLMVSIVLGAAGMAFAHDDHEEQYVIEEAARRNIELLSAAEARELAAKQFKSGNVRFKEVELEDEHDDYPNAENFRPVYKIECYADGQEYDVEIDAVTGKVLKFKRDD